MSDSRQYFSGIANKFQQILEAHMTIRHYVLISLILFLATGFGKNLERLSRTGLTNHELLDIHLDGLTAYIPGGLGGLNIVDLSDPFNPQVIGEYHAAGCDWGRIYAWATSGNYAYGTGRDCGIHVIDVSNLNSPQHVQTYHAGGAIRYEHPAVQGSYLFAARHQDGIEILSLNNITPITVIPTFNAWASLPDDSILYVADGSGGLTIINISNPAQPEQLASLPTTGSARDLDKNGNFLFIAVGADGVDMIDVNDPSNPLFIDNYNTTGFASRVAVSDSLVAVSDWDDVEVLSYLPTGLELMAYKNTGGRVMAIAMNNDIVFSAEWNKFQTFRINENLTVDIDFSTRKLEFPRVASGNQGLANLIVENTGSDYLAINDIQIQYSIFTIPVPINPIAAGDSLSLSVTYIPNGSTWNSNAIFHSNDTDESSVSIRLIGNFPFGPMPGDPAPNFDLAIVNGSGNLSRDDLLGNPAVIAFFTGW